MEALHREIREETGVKNVLTVIEDLFHFEFSDPNPTDEYVYGVEVTPSDEIVFDREEHTDYRWCSFREALQLLTWEENKTALRRLHKIQTKHST